MRSKHLLLMLLLALMAPWVAMAQKALPYSYGFEDNDLSTDGWTMFDNVSGTGINSSAKKTGSYGFRFYYGYSDQYLISPELTGTTTGVDVSFYMKNEGGYEETFKVGYSTTTNETSAFTWGAEMDVPYDWTEFSDSYPAGTKYIAVRYTGYDQFYWYIDDFSFKAVAAYPKPKQLAVAGLSSTSAKLSWTAPNNTVTNYKYQYKAASSSTWSSEVTVTTTSASISGLTAGTDYDFRVKATYSGNSSDYATATFTTLTPKAIPYAYGFEDAGETTPDIDNIWTVKAVDPYTMAWSNTYFGEEMARTGDYFFAMSSYNTADTPSQYLISPQLGNIENGLHVEFYYKQYASGEEHFKVGYSTTDNAVGSFTWSTEYDVTAEYQRFSANYPAETKFFAVQYTSDYQYFLFLDDFLFEESASCIEPGDVVVDNITTTGASINWTPVGSETAWDIYVTDDATDVPVDATTPTYPNITTNPYPLTGLTSATTYYVYVRARCSSSDHSAWSVPAVFNTECEAMALPYSYDFEEDALSVCWSTINPNTSYNSITISTADPQAGSKHLNLYRGTHDGIQIIALPEVDASYPVNGYEITFYSKLAGSYTSGRALAVGVMTDPEDATTFVQIGDLIEPTTSYVKYKVRLNTYTGNGQYIAIKHTSTYGYYGNTYIDNLEVKAIPNCIEPSNPVVSNITNHAAKLDWEGTSASYNVDYRTAAYLDGIDEGFEGGSLPAGWTHIGNGITTISNSSHTGTYSLKFSGATSNNVVVLPALSKELKAMGGLSFWSLAESSSSSGTFQVGYVTDATDVSTFNQVASFNASAHTAYTHVENVSFASAPNGARLAFRHTSGSDYFYWWIDDISMGEEVPAGEWQHTTSTTNTKTLESLLASRKYDVRVQGNCGSETSEWSGIVSFTTEIACPAPTDLDYSNLKSNRVDLSWTNGGSADWVVAYKKTADADFTEVAVATADVTIEGTTVTYTLTGLDVTTAYTVKVKDNCEASVPGDGESAWTSTIEFTTTAACAVDNVTVNNIGHYTATVNWDGESAEGFIVKYRKAAYVNGINEEFTTTPSDWTGYSVPLANGTADLTGSSSSYWSVGTGNDVLNGNHAYMNLYGQKDYWYVTPSFTIPSGVVFSFDVAYTPYSNYNSLATDCTTHRFAVLISTDKKNWTILREWNNNGSTYVLDNISQTGETISNISLSDYVGQTVYVGFYGHSETTVYDNNIHFDNVMIGSPVAAGTWQTLSPNPTTTTANLTGLTAGTKYEVTVAPICDEALVSDPVEFTTVSANVKYFINEGNWDVASNWEPAGVPTIEQDVELKANATIPSNCVAEAKSIAGTGTGTGAKTLTIESGAKLKHLNYYVTATVKKTITGYGAGNETNKANYYLIANPLETDINATSTPAISTTGLLTGNYDLYDWDYSASDGNEWRNYEKDAFDLYSAYSGISGYLYANEATTTLTFTGTINPYTYYRSNYLYATSSTTYDFPGWYLLGNPYLYDAYLASSSSNGISLPYYRLNTDGDDFVAVAATTVTPIAPMEGFFYQATTTGSVYVVTTAPDAPDAGLLNMNLRSGSKQLDNAIVAFGSEQRLEKFSFRANSSKIYMPVEGKDYAITNAEPQGEMPVSFKAENNGSYTLSFNTENVEFGYLHLIDNMTGKDVNLLETPSYSFEAKTTDYASRFKLVFSTGNGVNEESFAFISDGNIILNGEGMLQVVDVMGRIMMQEENATSVSTSGMTPGVYVLRLINGDSVKTQKIVIK